MEFFKIVKERIGDFSFFIYLNLYSINYFNDVGENAMYFQTKNFFNKPSSPGQTRNLNFEIEKKELEAQSLLFTQENALFVIIISGNDCKNSRTHF